MKKWERRPKGVNSQNNYFLAHLCELLPSLGVRRPSWRAELSDTILKGTHPGTIPARFGLIWPIGFRGEDFFKSLQTDDGPQVMAIAHIGELKSNYFGN
jgi:hypothetical protein